MTQKPCISPEVVSFFTHAVPRRLIKKLDKNPTMAADWQWERQENQWQVDSGKAVVTLVTSPVGIVQDNQISCSCLLSPKCLHILAVIGQLPLGDGALTEGEEIATDGVKTYGTQAAEGDRKDVRQVRNKADTAFNDWVQLSKDQVEAAAQMYQVFADIIHRGSLAFGTIAQGALLRCVHECRALGLHRLAGLGIRVVSGIRGLRESKPSFRLAVLADDILEMGLVAHQLKSGERVESIWVGTARRVYLPMGNKRLFGLFCEPVVTGSGYSGVVTYLTDGEGLYTISDVQPGDAVRAFAAYEGGAGVGEVSLSHQKLCRGGLFLQSATASADGRLGAGKSVGAVRADGCSWWEAPIWSLFDTPIPVQLERIWNTLEKPPGFRPAGGDLLYTSVSVLGLLKEALLAKTADGRVFRCVIPTGIGSLAYRDNLTRLAGAPGLSLLIVGRVFPQQPHTLGLLACGPAEAAQDKFLLSKEYGGRVNLGLDLLQGNNIPPSSTPRDVTYQSIDVPDPLLPLRRRLARMVLGGQATLPPGGVATVDREVNVLSRQMMPTAAQLLASLQQTALQKKRNVSGVLETIDGQALAQIWLQAGVYEKAVTAKLYQEQWSKKEIP